MYVFNCERCNLEITKDGDNYRYRKPGLVVPTKLQEFGTLRRAYETELCPLCGFKMSKE